MSRIVEFTDVDGHSFSIPASFVEAIYQRRFNSDDKTITTVQLESSLFGSDGCCNVRTLILPAEAYDDAVRRWKEAPLERGAGRMSRIVEFTFPDGARTNVQAKYIVSIWQQSADRFTPPQTIVTMVKGELVQPYDSYDEAVRRWKEALEEQ